MRLRSVLYTPGTKPDRIQKALESGAADVVVADLEDAVAPGDKIEARIAVRNALLATRESSQAVRAVRINAWPSSLAEDDLDVVLEAAPDLIVVPKAEEADAIEALGRRLDEAGDVAEHTRLLLICETAKGVLQAAATGAASPRVVALAIGAEDLAADAGMRRTVSGDEVRTARQLVVLAAAAAGVESVDMICADVEDAQRVGREAAEARQFGFAGKMCIHPAQVAPIHAAYEPDPDEVAWAQRVMAAVDAGGLEGGGVAVVDGKMIDVPLIKQAQRILAET